MVPYQAPSSDVQYQSLSEQYQAPQGHDYAPSEHQQYYSSPVPSAYFNDYHQQQY